MVSVVDFLMVSVVDFLMVSVVDFLMVSVVDFLMVSVQPLCTIVCNRMHQHLGACLKIPSAGSWLQQSVPTV